MVWAFVRKLITSASGITWVCRPRLSSGSSKESLGYTLTVVRSAVLLNQIWDAHQARTTLVAMERVLIIQNFAVRPRMMQQQTGGLEAKYL